MRTDGAFAWLFRWFELQMTVPVNSCFGDIMPNIIISLAPLIDEVVGNPVLCIIYE